MWERFDEEMSHFYTKRKTFFKSPHLNNINPKTSFMDTDQHLLVKTLENYDTFFGETKNMSDDYDHDDEEKIC